MSADIGRLPLHLAFSWLGVGQERPEGVAVRHEVGPYVEGLAEVFEKVTVLAYEPPAEAMSSEDVAEYVVQTPHRNVGLLSLGPKGSWKDLVKRQRKVRATVRRASAGWDVLLLRFDRRAHLVFGGNNCPRTIAMVHGHSGAVSEPGLPFAERIRMIPLSVRSRWHLRRIVRGSGLLVTDGEQYLATYARYASASELIRHSIRRAKWSHDVADRLTGPAPRFLFVGRTSRRKGIFETLEAFAEIRARLLPDAQLDVVGTGSDLEAARELAQTIGIGECSTFHDTVEPGEPMSALYREADVLLFLSRSESFPKVVTEAMAHSVLVVGTPVGSLPMAFRNGREMMFVEATPESVLAAVKTLLDDPDKRRTMIKHGQVVGRETSLESVVARLASVVVGRWPELASTVHTQGATKWPDPER